MEHSLISGDNHIDLTYCPADLWSSQAPAKWKLVVPRVEDLDDGQHWFVEGQDKGMWNGVGPGFLKYQQGVFGHIDEMKEAGFTWDSRKGATPRPTTPELRLADLDRDGLEKEIIYGCLMVNDLIDDAELRVGPTPATTTGPPTSPSAPIPIACFRSPSSPTPIPRPRPLKCGAAPSWGSRAATSPSSA